MEILTLKNIISYLFIGFIVLFSISMLVAFFVKLTRAGKNAPKAVYCGVNDILNVRNDTKQIRRVALYNPKYEVIYNPVYDVLFNPNESKKD